MKQVDICLMPWKWDGIALLGCPESEFIRVVKEQTDETLDAHNGMGRAYLKKGSCFVLWVEDETNFPSLAHEALHITAAILEQRGLTLSESSEEAYTYTMEDILRQVLK